MSAHWPGTIGAGGRHGAGADEPLTVSGDGSSGQQQRFLSGGVLRRTGYSNLGPVRGACSRSRAHGCWSTHQGAGGARIAGGGAAARVPS